MRRMLQGTHVVDGRDGEIVRRRNAAQRDVDAVERLLKAQRKQHQFIHDALEPDAPSCKYLIDEPKEVNGVLEVSTCASTHYVLLAHVQLLRRLGRLLAEKMIAATFEGAKLWSRRGRHGEDSLGAVLLRLKKIPDVTFEDLGFLREAYRPRAKLPFSDALIESVGESARKAHNDYEKRLDAVDTGTEVKPTKAKKGKATTVK